jgi:hypothetical protein
MRIRPGLAEIHQHLIPRHAPQPRRTPAPLGRGVFHRNVRALISGEEGLLADILGHIRGGTHIAEVSIDHRLMRADEKF